MLANETATTSDIEMERRKFFGLSEGECNDDPFYSVENMRRLQKSIAQAKRGQVVTVTLEELRKLVYG